MAIWLIFWRSIAIVFGIEQYLNVILICICIWLYIYVDSDIEKSLDYIPEQAKSPRGVEEHKLDLMKMKASKQAHTLVGWEVKVDKGEVERREVNLIKYVTWKTQRISKIQKLILRFHIKNIIFYIV